MVKKLAYYVFIDDIAQSQNSRLEQSPIWWNKYNKIAAPASRKQRFSHMSRNLILIAFIGCHTVLEQCFPKPRLEGLVAVANNFKMAGILLVTCSFHLI